LNNSNPDLTSLQVLVVEDEAVTRTALTILLEQLGARVFAVGTVQEGIQAIEQNLHPHLVLCNLRLPDGNGIGVLQAVREQDQQLGRRTPTIVLSGDSPPLEQLNALSDDVYQFLAKPFDSKTLIDTIRQLLAKQTD
jgi:CheY-like chemotaxis protein